MGERVATGIIIEHMLQKDEPLEMNFHSFDGDLIHFLKTGKGAQVDIHIIDSQGASVTFEDWWVRHLVVDAAAPAPTGLAAKTRHEEKPEVMA